MNNKNILCPRGALPFLISLLLLALHGCGGRFDIYSPSEIHRTVRPLEPGVYIVSYKWPYVIDNYGPNMTLLLKDADDKDKPEIWEKAMASAVPKYLESKGIVPKGCTQGVIIIRSGETEGGGGWAEFRCK